MRKSEDFRSNFPKDMLAFLIAQIFILILFELENMS